MKKPQIDIFSTVVQQYINQIGFKNKFLRLWGHNGTVLNEKHYYYPTISESDIKLFKLLGLYKDLKESQGKMKGITSAWVYLNPSKFDVTTLDDDLLVQQLEFNVPDGVYTINIVPNVAFTRVSWRNKSMVHVTEDTLGLLNYTDKVALGAYIEANYAQVIDRYIVEGAEELAMTNLVLMHILGGSDAFEHNIKSVEYALMDNVKNTIINNETNKSISYRYSVKSISIEVEVKQIGTVAIDDPIVLSILAQRNKEALKARVLSEKDSATVNNNTLSDALYEGPTTVTNDAWLEDRFRVSVFSSKVLKTKQLMSLLQGSLDTGYQKKKTKWWKKIIGIIVFVIVFYFTGGLTGGFAAFAFSFSVATLAVTLTSAAMGAWGDETGAQAVGKFSKGVSKIGMVIGIAAMVSSISTAIAQAATKQTLAEAAKQGIKLTTAEVTKQASARSLLDTLKGMVVDYFKSGLVTNLSLEQGLSLTNGVFGMYSKNKLESIQSKLKSVQQQNAEYAQFEEENRSRDIGKSLIKSHGEMFHQDSLDTYDYMYESWSSPMHVGNIQRTSWKWNRTGDKINLRDD